MIDEAKCFTRRCKHYIGVFQPDGTEMTERHVCAAFPERIPDEIAYGNDKHLNVRSDQKNNIVFEEEK
jgi:hypothetical protein